MKNFIYLSLALIFLIGSPQLSFSQSNNLTDVTRFNPNYFKAIKDADKNVVGYFIFFKTDKAPKGMAIFQLNIYDTEFNLVINKKMTEPKLTKLLASSSNGSSIIFKFFDQKNWKMKYKGYDYEGNQVITKSRTISDKYEKSLLARPNPYADYVGILPIPGYGYAEYNIIKQDKMNYSINYYPDNKASRSWVKKGKTGRVESALRVGTIDELILTTVYSREKLMSTKGMETRIVAHDATDGDKRFDINLQDEKINTIIISGTASRDGENIVLYGLDYPLDDKLSKKSVGLIEVNMNKDGEVLDTKRLSWEKDFNFKDDEDKDFGNLHIHEFFQGADGHTIIVAEQFSLNAGLSLAGSLLGGGQNISFKIDDLLIIDLDENFKVSNLEVIKKSRNNFTIPGIPLGSSTAIGMMAEAYGYFDFSYIQGKKKEGEFTVGFIDWERKAGEKNGFAFSGVTYADGKYATDKISLVKKKTDVYVREAKPGYISILEYSKKLKTLEFRLEKINF